MKFATLHPNLRAAVREKLLTVVDIDHAPGVAVTAAAGVFERASGSWIDAGFAPGQEVTATGAGFSGAGVGMVRKVEALKLTTDIAANGASSDARFVVALPQGRAWEGRKYEPVSGRPYVAEQLRPGPSRKKGLGKGGIIEHSVNAIFALFYPMGFDTLAIERMAGAVINTFMPGGSLEHGEAKASISNAERTALFSDGNWINATVSVSLLTWTNE